MRKRLGSSYTVIASIASSLAILLVASSASAVSTRLYLEGITSDASIFFAANTRYSIDIALDDIGPGTLGDIIGESSTVLGDGRVGTDVALNYTHTFAPVAPVTEIIRAAMAVAVVDDQRCRCGPEDFAITLDQDADPWRSGGVSFFRVFGGSVLSYIQDNQDDTGGSFLDVSLTGRDGLTVLGSGLAVLYTTGGDRIDGVVPEPTAATLFCAGVLVIGAGSRGRNCPC